MAFNLAHYPSGGTQSALLDKLLTTVGSTVITIWVQAIYNSLEGKTTTLEKSQAKGRTTIPCSYDSGKDGREVLYSSRFLCCI